MIAKHQVRRWLVGLGDHRADDARLSGEGVQRGEVVHVPQLEVFLRGGGLAGLTGPVPLPEREGVLERLVVLFLEDDEAAVAVPLELGHHRPVGVEGVKDEGIDEGPVGLMQPVDQPLPGGQFSFMAAVVAVGVAAGFIRAERFDRQDDVEHGPDEHGDHIGVVILRDLLDLPVGRLCDGPSARDSAAQCRS